MTKELKRPHLNIQLFAEGEGGGENQIEVPEHITNYVNTLENAEQKEYMQGLLTDEKSVEMLKGFIKDPNADIEYNINANDYQDIGVDIEAYTTYAKENKIPESVLKHQLNARKEYLQSERELMTPELRSLDEPIKNFIGAEKDEGIQNVYKRLAENSKGREVLQKIMGMQHSPSPQGPKGEQGKREAYDHKTFIDAYNIALDTSDKNKMADLKAFANSSQDRFYKDFINE